VAAWQQEDVAGVRVGVEGAQPEDLLRLPSTSSARVAGKVRVGD
jgi:hypothetical protein